jgi:hypothetical protein
VPNFAGPFLIVQVRQFYSDRVRSRELNIANHVKPPDPGSFWQHPSTDQAKHYSRRNIHLFTPPTTITHPPKEKERRGKKEGVQIFKRSGPAS